jgi:hypothetical protein
MEGGRPAGHYAMKSYPHSMMPVPEEHAGGRNTPLGDLQLGTRIV